MIIVVIILIILIVFVGVYFYLNTCNKSTKQTIENFQSEEQLVFNINGTQVTINADFSDGNIVKVCDLPESEYSQFNYPNDVGCDTSHEILKMTLNFEGVTPIDKNESVQSITLGSVDQLSDLKNLVAVYTTYTLNNLNISLNDIRFHMMLKEMIMECTYILYSLLS